MKKIGSYLKDDVVFLVKLVDIEETKIEEKEKLIQENKKHYSEMISPEYMPTKEYIDIFKYSLKIYSNKVASNIIQLSHYINNNIEKPIIVSLLRAGTPIGVLLHRTLKKCFNKENIHYSISIIRDKGIDYNALKFILKNEAIKNNTTIENIAKNIIFIDGWTGKGVIKKELEKSISFLNKELNINISSNLYVLADISGKADVSATFDDYLIPSSALNSTISGLISRSILNDELLKNNEFHGAKYYKELKNNDYSLYYINRIMKKVLNIYSNKIEFENLNFVMNNDKLKKELEIKCDSFLNYIKEKYKIKNINFIKPGIGETTRVLLRRNPDFIILKDENLQEIQHILKLIKEKNIKIIIEKELPYSVVGIIKSVD